MQKISRAPWNVNYNIEIRPQGLKLKRSGLPPIPNAPKGRQAIKTLSVASGSRLRDNLESVNPDHGFPMFITLTYPIDYPGNWEVWKRHLDNFRRSLHDIHGQQWIGAIWRLEAQRRGAPHYHLLLWGKHPFDRQKDFKQWVSRTWYRIVGSQDPKHLAAGTQVKMIRKTEDYHRRMGYLCKYLGKDSVHENSQVFNNPVGRYWGVWNKSTLLIPPDCQPIGSKVYDKLRRCIRKKREKRNQGKKQALKGKQDFNRTRKAQRKKPGTREFLRECISRRLLEFYDPPPF